MEIMREPTCFIITQSKIMRDLISEFDCSSLPTVSAPLDPSTKLSDASGTLSLDPTIYRRLIDCAACRDSRKSVSGFFIRLELIGLTRLLTDLSLEPSLPIPLYSDRQAAIHIARNPVFYERTKHVELDCHFVRQQFLSGLKSLSFISSKSQLAGLFNKPLSGPSLHTILGKLGLSSFSSKDFGDDVIVPTKNDGRRLSIEIPAEISSAELLRASPVFSSTPSISLSDPISLTLDLSLRL
ncbi:uncharacterized protein LOC124897893 [Capsicum annuum]|uniref:uncharacterized protein LOC124897893 n=1 Tax=Capsicum annuum TaxID=4072 RepID=UPI001FB0F7D8|nr:uncharacterized protein LOC124897893 [Capsicum annuum]